MSSTPNLRVDQTKWMSCLCVVVQPGAAIFATLYAKTASEAEGKEPDPGDGL